MVLILHGNSEHVAPTLDKIFDLYCQSNRMPSTDQIQSISICTCAPISELPSNTSTIYSVGPTPYINQYKLFPICLLFNMNDTVE